MTHKLFFLADLKTFMNFGQALRHMMFLVCKLFFKERKVSLWGQSEALAYGKLTDSAYLRFT